jgi:hypothetical protein
MLAGVPFLLVAPARAFPLFAPLAGGSSVMPDAQCADQTEPRNLAAWEQRARHAGERVKPLGIHVCLHLSQTSRVSLPSSLRQSWPAGIRRTTYFSISPPETLVAQPCVIVAGVMKDESMAVSTKRRRAHVVLPEELLREIDARVGQRKRCEFIQQAVEEKLNYLGRIEAFERIGGSIADGEVPEWDTPDSTAEWLRALREEWSPDRLSRDRIFAEAGVTGICLESPR